MAKILHVLGASLFITGVISHTIELAECNPPDFPQWGSYGPREEVYLPGDVIHYFCDVGTYIGGNYYRRCEDTGDWTGDTPVCDSPASFSSTTQTSTAEPVDGNGANKAMDGLRTTCTSTLSGEGSSWFGTFATPGELIRVMVFLPKVEVAYEVFLVTINGTELSCGTKRGRIDRHDWEFHNCPGPHNRDAAGVKIKSLDTSPLQICEVNAYVLTSPTCVDPHLIVDSGRFQISRKHASLICDKGFTRSRIGQVRCIRDGVWKRESLYCMEEQWEQGERHNEGPTRDWEPQISQNVRHQEPQTSQNERHREPQTSQNERHEEPQTSQNERHREV